MKNISKIFLMFLLGGILFSSCETDETTYSNLTPEGALITLNGVNPGFFDLGDPTNAAATATVGTVGQDVSSATLTVSFGGNTVDYGTVNTFPSEVTMAFSEAVTKLGLNADSLTVGDVFTFGFKDVVTSSGTYSSGTTASLALSCPSLLAGTYAYSTTGWCGEVSTGEATFTEVAGGIYEISDWSYGSYPACYNGFVAESWGSLQLQDVCNKLSILGVDAYDDTWTFSQVEVDGANLTLTWENTYGESGTTVLTRADGSSWPPLSL